MTPAPLHIPGQEEHSPAWPEAMGCSSAWQSLNGPFISAEQVTFDISASQCGCQRPRVSETDPSPLVS